MDYTGKSHYQIFSQAKEFPLSLKITHIGSSITQAQWVSVSLNINHRIAHFKFVTRLRVMKTCVENQGSKDFEGCNEAWLQRKLVFLNIQKTKQAKRAITVQNQSSHDNNYSFTFTKFLFLLHFLFSSPFLSFISFQSVLLFFFFFFFILQRIRFQHSLTKE